MHCRITDDDLNSRVTTLLAAAVSSDDEFTHYILYIYTYTYTYTYGVYVE